MVKWLRFHCHVVSFFGGVFPIQQLDADFLILQCCIGTFAILDLLRIRRSHTITGGEC